MRVPKDLKYTKTHEWIRVKGKEAVVGITEYAQSELGDITFIELPVVNDDLAQLGRMAVIESVKAASDIYAPVSGKVIAANEALQNHPEKINESPYGDGWIARIEMKDQSEIHDLMDADAYEAHLEELD